MRQLTDLVIQIDELDGAYELRAGSVFVGCEMRQHEIRVWYMEDPDISENKIYLLSCFAELGRVEDDAKYIGFCGNPVFGEDETYHTYVRMEDGTEAKTINDTEINWKDIKRMIAMEVHKQLNKEGSDG